MRPFSTLFIFSAVAIVYVCVVCVMYITFKDVAQLLLISFMVRDLCVLVIVFISQLFGKYKSASYSLIDSGMIFNFSIYYFV